MRNVFQYSNNGNRLTIVIESIVNANVKNIVEVFYRVFLLAVLNVWSLFDIKSAKVSKDCLKGLENLRKMSVWPDGGNQVIFYVSL